LLLRIARNNIKKLASDALKDIMLWKVAENSKNKVRIHKAQINVSELFTVKKVMESVNSVLDVRKGSFWKIQYAFGQFSMHKIAWNSMKKMNV